MKTVFAALALSLLASAASAQVSCTRSGDMTFCSDGRSFIHSGNTTYGSGSGYPPQGGNQAKGFDASIFNNANKPTVRSNNDYYNR